MRRDCELCKRQPVDGALLRAVAAHPCDGALAGLQKPYCRNNFVCYLAFYNLTAPRSEMDEIRGRKSGESVHQGR